MHHSIQTVSYRSALQSVIQSVALTVNHEDINEQKTIFVEKNKRKYCNLYTILIHSIFIIRNFNFSHLIIIYA